MDNWTNLYFIVICIENKNEGGSGPESRTTHSLREQAGATALRPRSGRQVTLTVEGEHALSSS